MATVCPLNKTLLHHQENTLKTFKRNDMLWFHYAGSWCFRKNLNMHTDSKMSFLVIRCLWVFQCCFSAPYTCVLGFFFCWPTVSPLSHYITFISQKLLSKVTNIILDSYIRRNLGFLSNTPENVDRLNQDHTNQLMTVHLYWLNCSLVNNRAL